MINTEVWYMKPPLSYAIDDVRYIQELINQLFEYDYYDLENRLIEIRDHASDLLIMLETAEDHRKRIEELSI